MSNKLDVLIWGHSDQAGGTEMACVIATGFLRRLGPAISCGIITYNPPFARNFFKSQGGLSRGIEIIGTAPLLELGKDEETQQVSKTKTLEVIKNRFSGDRPERLLRDFIRKVEDRKHEKTLMISCGEPFAVQVARELGIKVIIITDHFVTKSVEDILSMPGESEIDEFTESEAREILGKLIQYESSPSSPDNTVILSPTEFGGESYPEWAHRRLHWSQCLEMGGLLYDPIPIHELERAPHYNDLLDLTQTKKTPLVIVFGGGGTVWDEIYKKLHDEYRLKIDNCDLKFALIVRDGWCPTGYRWETIRGYFRLFTPESPQGTRLYDPGKMMYWYALCSLMVGRGGLASQQVLATMLSERREHCPFMLFVEEPHHPQIKWQRKKLSSLGFVAPCTLNAFINNPVE